MSDKIIKPSHTSEWFPITIKLFDIFTQKPELAEKPELIEKPKLTHADLEEARITGELHFFFSVDMREFLFEYTEENYYRKSEKIYENTHYKRIRDEDFEKLQASKDFAKSLADLPSFFEIDKTKEFSKDGFKYEDIECVNAIPKRGFDNGIFGGALWKDWFRSKTSVIYDNEGIWLIRCSWLGLFEIHLIKQLVSQTSIQVLDEILESRTTTDDKKSVWHKVFDRINIFCRKVESARKRKKDEADIMTKFSFKPNDDFREEKNISFAERQRYIIVAAKEIYCDNYGKDRLPATELLDSNLLPAMLYAALVSNKNDPNSEAHIPVWENNDDNKIKNLSTWKDEICVFASERGFIYYDSSFKVNDKDKFDYDEYWQYIIRGVQHTVSVRAALQSLQTQIRKQTDKLPELISKIDKEEYPIHDIAFSLANILQIMPQISNVCIPTIAFKANYAVSKFQYLNEECFRFSEILIALRRDIRSISSFLEFAKSYQLRLDVRKRSEEDGKQSFRLQLIGLFIALVTIFLVGPSFIVDYANFRGFSSSPTSDNNGSHMITGEKYYFISVGIIAVSVLALYGVLSLWHRFRNKTK